jgi:di/tricarboxylate transporter
LSQQITISLGILVAAALLLISERMREDLVALLVLVVLALSGMVTPTEALSGFSNPAVITVWSVFVLSASLARTGVAAVLGRQLLRVAGESEARLLLVIMLGAGAMSAFMNNVGVTAMLLPVVVNAARQTGRAPSKFLIPLAFASMLGGQITLIGTPPNILASNALQENGLLPFGFLDFAPLGLILLAVGVLYMLFLGRKLLPSRDVAREFRPMGAAPAEVFALKERLFYLGLPGGARLAGLTLAESRIGSALNLNVISVQRNGHNLLAPPPDEVLHSGDRLLVSGRPDRLEEVGQNLPFEIIENGMAAEDLSAQSLASPKIKLIEIIIRPESSFEGRNLAEAKFRENFGVLVLAIMQGGRPRRTDVQAITLGAGDHLLAQATPAQIKRLSASDDFEVQECESPDPYQLGERLYLFRIPENSQLAGKSLTESHLGEFFGVGVMAVLRDGKRHLMPAPGKKLKVGDKLLVKCRLDNLNILRGLQELSIDSSSTPRPNEVESEEVGLVEVVLSPHTTIGDKTLGQINFREKYGLSVLALWRAGRAYRYNLRDMPLRLGDALLVHGKRANLRVLGTEPDFIVLEEGAQEPPRTNKATAATLIMALVVITVAFGLLPISIAAVTGTALMVLSGCLTMEEAYRAIEWRAVFLIAGMLPLGIAMENSGAASFLAQQVVELLGGYGPIALMAGFFLLTNLVAQVMPKAVVLVLMAPIAISTALNMQISPYSLVMLVAVASSPIFLSPLSHPDNVIIMGPGGYRMADFLKVGFPLTVLVMIVTVLVLPIFWPLTP